MYAFPQLSLYLRLVDHFLSFQRIVPLVEQFSAVFYGVPFDVLPLNDFQAILVLRWCVNNELNCGFPIFVIVNSASFVGQVLL